VVDMELLSEAVALSVQCNFCKNVHCVCSGKC
jgi:hypothetical protein